jgi:PAS domain S-box-containing protein
VGDEAIIKQSADGFPSAPFEGLLVRIRGRLVQRTRTNDERVYLLQRGPDFFTAHLFPAQPTESPLKAGALDLPMNSLLELTGICVVHGDKDGDPKSFEVLLRSAQDIVIVKRAPWWDLEHTLGLLFVTGLVALAALGWVSSLRRRVRQQTGALMQSARWIQETLENVPLLALNLDASGRVVFCNHYLLRLLGKTHDEVIGANWAESFVLRGDADGDGDDISTGSLESDCRLSHQDRIQAKNGEERLISWYNTAIHDSEGNVVMTSRTGSGQNRN